MKMNLEEFVTMQSLHSRRQLLQLIKEGKVLVNQKVIESLSHPVDTAKDFVEVDGAVIRKTVRYLYYKFHKPKGVLSTMSDPKNRRCIGDLIRKINLPVYPVGRLDRQSSGLMILTNDGDFSHRLMHPGFEVKKSYVVELDKKLKVVDRDRLERGIFLEDGPVRVRFDNRDLGRHVSVTITEGRNRIIRRAFEHCGYFVQELKRTRIKNWDLKGIQPGEMLELKDVSAPNESKKD